MTSKQDREVKEDKIEQTEEGRGIPGCQPYGARDRVGKSTEWEDLWEGSCGKNGAFRFNVLEVGQFQVMIRSGCGQS